MYAISLSGFYRSLISLNFFSYFDSTFSNLKFKAKPNIGYFHLIIAVLGLYQTSTPLTTWDYFEENYYKAIFSYNIDG